MTKVRVHYTPSLAGHLHVRNARTALFNYLFVCHNGGELITRIGDTDQKRDIEDGEKSQLENSTWLGIGWDESSAYPGEYGPYHQSERKETYRPLIDQLLNSNRVYKCYYTPEELEAKREAQQACGETPHYAGTYASLTPSEQAAKEAAGLEPVVRSRVPRNTEYKFDDIVKGEIIFESDNVGGDFIIQKHDGMPTYNFVAAVDDHLVRIPHALRGGNRIANTPKQLMVYEAFEWTPPVFDRMTLIVNSETDKELSKRGEAILQFIEQYRGLGYLPEAMFNFIILLGWFPAGEEEIFSQEDLVKLLDEQRLNKSPAAFDVKKLEWISNQYMKQMSLSGLTDMCTPYLAADGRVEENPPPERIERLKQLVSLYQPQMSYAAEIVELSNLFFGEHPVLDDAAKEFLQEETVPAVLHAFKEQLEALDVFDVPSIKTVIKAVQKEAGAKGESLFVPIWIAVSRQMHGPELGETIELSGKEKALDHLNKVL